MRLYIVILLCVLVSCSKRESQTLYSGNKHQNDSTIINYSVIKSIDKFIGKWHYYVWINDSAYENKSFSLKLRKKGKDTVDGLFISVWFNGERIDGDLENEVDANVWGYLRNDSLFVNIKGSYNENSSAKAVLCLNNDSTLLWKLTEIDGEIYIPEKVLLEKYD